MTFLGYFYSWLPWNNWVNLFYHLSSKKLTLSLLYVQKSNTNLVEHMKKKCKNPKRVVKQYVYFKCFQHFLPSHLYSQNLSIPPSSCCYLVSTLRPSVCDHVNYSTAAFSVHGISQAWLLEWVVFPFSRGSSWPKDPTHIACIGRYFLYHWAT